MKIRFLFFQYWNPQQPLEPKCPFVFILDVVNVKGDNKREGWHRLFCRCPLSSGRQWPCLGEKETPLGGTQVTGWLSRSPAPSELADVNRQHFLGFKVFNFLSFIFFFLFFLQSIKLAKKLAEAGGHCGGGGSVEKSPPTHTEVSGHGC